MGGMAKVMNRTMEQLLQIHATTDSWVTTLPLVAMMINATPQSQTGRTPNEVAYRCKLRIAMDVVTTPMTVPTAEEYITRIQCTWESVQQRVTQQQINDAQRADQARREAGIMIGDNIVLSSRNLKLKSRPGKL